MKEYVEHKRNGLLFKHRNENDLTQKMLFAIKNPKILQNFGNVGYLYSKSGTVPNIKGHCIELTEIYKQIITAK